MTQPDPLDAAKQSMRERMLPVRAAIATAQGDKAARAVAERALAFLKDRHGAAVAGYAAMRGELDLLPLLTRLAREGYPVCLPVVAAPDAALLFRRWHPGEALETGAHGIAVPGISAEEITPEVVLVPLVAFDLRGCRLGMGGGYYDRTLAGLRRHEDVIAIGMAFDEQEVEAVPHGPHDQRLDAVVTPGAAITIDS